MGGACRLCGARWYGWVRGPYAAPLVRAGAYGPCGVRPVRAATAPLDAPAPLRRAGAPLREAAAPAL
ncbi:hypothetical protein ACH4GK_25430 [Streptomyces rimosus]|uniref:hypothetical protein n=1 Tax=Streptomyces rimosus TaxID=1927 RepID=UPI00131EC9B3|nr:hypothetical protein [Streptomyces rimosus]